MVYKRSGNAIILRPELGEDIVECLKRLMNEEGLLSASVVGIGGTSDAKIGLYDLDKKKYDFRQVNKFSEITSIVGNLSRKNGEPYVHLHVTLFNEDGLTGGHLASATISATAEIYVTATDIKVEREAYEPLGLNHLAFEDAKIVKINK